MNDETKKHRVETAFDLLATREFLGTATDRGLAISRETRTPILLASANIKIGPSEMH